MIKWKSKVAVAVMACLSLVFAASITSSAAAGPPAPTAPPPLPAHIGPADITPNPELVYVSVTPCRIVDTRSTGADFNSGTVRNYWVTGTVGFAGQGGKAGGCGIPSGARAITASFTALNTGGPGFIRAWAAGGSEPQATLLNYSHVNTGTGVTVQIRPGSSVALTVKNYSGPTDLVIDVTGYYAPQSQAFVSFNGAVINQSGRLLNVDHTAGSGTYTLTWDRDVSACAVQITPYNGSHWVSAYNSGGSTTDVWVRDSAGSFDDYWFYVSVNC